MTTLDREVEVFDDKGRLVGVAFRELELPPVEAAHVFNEHGRLVGFAFRG